MKGGKFFRIFLILLLGIFVVYQVFAAFYHPFTTVSAIYYETNSGIDAEAFLVRNENVITNSDAGVKCFSVEDGERVSKGGKIADVYPSQAVSNVYSQINELKKKLDSLQKIKLYNDGGTDVKTVSEKILNKISEYSVACANGKFDQVDTLQTELLTLISSKQSIIGRGNSIDSMISSVEAELATLKTTVEEGSKVISSTMSGYFVSKVDGYEQVITPENVLELSPEELENIAPIEPAKNVVCKIVSDYTWYFAALISNDDALKLKEGSNYKVFTNQKDNNALNATLETINTSEKSDKTAVVFSCSVTDGVFSTIRNMPITIVLDSCKGIKIPNRAIRTVNDEIGVYVVSAGVIKFKKIDIIKTFDTFTVCKMDEDGDANRLRLYDEVVEKGKSLYDGKTVN